jgi:hypothetical protein
MSSEPSTFSAHPAGVGTTSDRADAENVIRGCSGGVSVFVEDYAQAVASVDM